MIYAEHILLVTYINFGIFYLLCTDLMTDVKFVGTHFAFGFLSYHLSWYGQDKGKKYVMK
jgi:hypothetical protein